MRNLRRLSKWPHDVEDRIAALQRVQQVRCLPRRLHYDVDRPLLRIRVLDRYRNPLALFVNPQNDELSRPLLPRNARRFNHKPLDTWR